MTSSEGDGDTVVGLRKVGNSSSSLSGRKLEGTKKIGFGKIF